MLTRTSDEPTFAGAPRARGEDPLDPEALARYEAGRRRAMGMAVGASFGIANAIFWSLAFGTQLELGLPLVAALGAGVLGGWAVLRALAPRRLRVIIEAQADLTEEELAALDSALSPRVEAPPRFDDAHAEDVSAELADARREALREQLRAALPVMTGLAVFGASMALLAWWIGVDAVSSLLPLAGGPALVIGLLVHRLVRGETPTVSAGVYARLATATQIELRREEGLLSALAAAMRVPQPRPRWWIEGDGADVAKAAATAPSSELARLSEALLPHMRPVRIDVRDSDGTPLQLRGDWRWLPLTTERCTLRDGDGQILGRIERWWGRYRAVSAEGALLFTVRRGWWSRHRFRIATPEGAIQGAIERIAPPWYFPYGQRGRRVAVPDTASASDRALLLAAALLIDLRHG